MSKKVYPEVFISYSWDSEEHKDKVYALATKLIEQDSVNADIDLFHTSPEEGWPSWMENNITNAKYVLIVATERYDKIYRGEEEEGKGKGVKWESLVTKNYLADIDSKNTKFIPIVFDAANMQYIPMALRGATRYDISSEEQYDLLIRHIKDKPLYPKPKLGSERELPSKTVSNVNTQVFIKELKSDTTNSIESKSSLFSNQLKAFKQLGQWLSKEEVKVTSKKISLEDMHEKKSNCLTTTIAQLNSFPGMGKSEISLAIEEYGKSNGYHVFMLPIAPESDSYRDDILLNLSDEFSEHFNKINNIEFTSLFNKKVLIILDDFQYVLKKNGELKKEMNFIKELTRTHKEGKLLCISSKKINFGEREGEVTSVNLDRMDASDASKYFDFHLKKSDIDVVIDDIQKEKLLKLINYNLRAINILISKFQYAEVDELIDNLPQNEWDDYDAEINQNLLKELEKQLLSDTLNRLSPEIGTLLEKLSVYRTNIDNGIFKNTEKYLKFNGDTFEAREILVNNLLLKKQKGWYVLNPIAREVLIRKLDTEKKVQLHKSAGDYCARHFTAKQTVSSSKLGSDFAEARYHFRRSNEVGKLSKISQRYIQYLLFEIQDTAKPPKDKNALDERIALLEALFKDGGPNKLAWHYTRCLLERAKDDDSKRALEFFEDGTLNYKGNVDMTHTFIDAVRVVNGVEEAISKGKSALSYLNNENGINQIYIKISNLLSVSGDILGAISLLKKGIEDIPASNNVFILYQEVSRLMEKNDQLDDAITLLKKGIEDIPASNNVFSLYQEASRLMEKNDQLDDAITLLKKGIEDISASNNRHRVAEQFIFYAGRYSKLEWIDEILKLNIHNLQKTLAKMIRLQILGRWSEISSIFNIEEAGNYLTLYIVTAYSYLHDNKPEKAQEVLDKFPLEVRDDKYGSNTWLKCLIALSNNDNELLSNTYKVLIGDNQVTFITKEDLFQIWKESKEAGTDISYHFPFPPNFLLRV